MELVAVFPGAAAAGMEGDGNVLEGRGEKLNLETADGGSFVAGLRKERKDKLTQDRTAHGSILEVKRLAYGIVNINRFT